MRNSGHKWKVSYHPSVRKDISCIQTRELSRIRNIIDRKLTTNPVLYGAPLRGSLKQLWKIRIGNHRVVFSLDKNLVRVLIIGDRKEVYKLADRRK